LIRLQHQNTFLNFGKRDEGLFATRKTLEVPAEEREAFWERLYASPSFGIWMGNFSDMLTDRAANALASDFIARKIRQRVHDPVVAEKLN
jgi:hypothetical protein